MEKNKIEEFCHLIADNQTDNLFGKNRYKKAPTILVDCHSFSKEIIMFDERKFGLPDICVGFNEYSATADFVLKYFRELGYKVKENYPYSGSMIPDCFLMRPNPNFFSVMIEVNKKLYLESRENFKKLQSEINALLKKLEQIKLN